MEAGILIQRNFEEMIQKYETNMLTLKQENVSLGNINKANEIKIKKLNQTQDKTKVLKEIQTAEITEFKIQCRKEFDEKLRFQRQNEQTYLASQDINIAQLEKDKAETLFEYEEMVIKV
jgi:hypothetical protein